MTQAYRIDGTYDGLPDGTLVYQPSSHDYGIASQDSRDTGVEHRSVTLNSDGSNPTFTIPVTRLRHLPSQKSP